jgi:hypothetical protein
VNSPRVHTTLPWVSREMEWHFGHSGASAPKKALRRSHGAPLGNTATWLLRMPLRARRAPRNGVLPCPRNVSAKNDCARELLTNRLCRTVLGLATPKLARNQMFTARCVPNMYLFGTSSAQNAPENSAMIAANRTAKSRRANRSLASVARTRRGSRGGGNVATREPTTPLRARLPPRRGIFGRGGSQNIWPDK